MTEITFTESHRIEKMQTMDLRMHEGRLQQKWRVLKYGSKHTKHDWLEEVTEEWVDVEGQP